MAVSNYIKNIKSIYQTDKTVFFFKIGMGWRILYGAIRIVLGLNLLRFVGLPFQQAYYGFMAKELIEDPNDLVVQTIGALLGYVPLVVTYFLVVYFIFWGLIDIVLSISLLKEKLWAFPVSLILIFLFLIFEIYRFFHNHSKMLAFIIVIDLILLWLINEKYKKLKQKEG